MKQRQREMKLYQNYLDESVKIHNLECTRRQKENKSDVVRVINAQKYQEKVRDLEDFWDKKKHHIMTLKDIEEFKRGMAKAELERKQHRFKAWM